MANIQIHPCKLEGSLTIPPSKSHTLRAIVFALLAKGVSRIENYLESPDTDAMLKAVCLLGAKVEKTKDALFIQGCEGLLHTPEDVIDCKNSGQVLRFIGALAGLIPGYTVLTGDESIRQNRPIRPLLDALTTLGVFAISTRSNGQAPIVVRGPFTKKVTEIEGFDSQPVSGLLIASVFSPFETTIHVKNPGETPWIDLTLHWFDKLQIPYQRNGYHFYKLEGGAKIEGFNYKVPGDFSTAAFPIASALLTNSEITLHNLDFNDPQGDKALISILQKMGALFAIDEKEKTLKVLKSPPLQGISIDLNHCIDALPILSVIGCFAKGQTRIYNAEVARKKESDRIAAIAKELKKMGAHIEEKEDGLIISSSLLHGATLFSHEDHRIALSLSVAGMAAQGETFIKDVDCIKKTYANFSKEFSLLGAKIFSC